MDEWQKIHYFQWQFFLYLKLHVDFPVLVEMPSTADCSGIPWQTWNVIIWTITFCVIKWQDGVSLKIVVRECLYCRDLTICGVVSFKDFVVIQVFITKIPQCRWFISILWAGILTEEWLWEHERRLEMKHQGLKECLQQMLVPLMSI